MKAQKMIPDVTTKPTKHKQTYESPTIQFKVEKNKVHFDSNSRGTKASALPLGLVGKGLEVDKVHL